MEGTPVIDDPISMAPGTHGTVVPRSRCQGLERWNGGPTERSTFQVLGFGTLERRSVPRSRCQGLERWNGPPDCPAVPRIRPERALVFGLRQFDLSFRGAGQ